jgi:hypothetical protein
MPRFLVERTFPELFAFPSPQAGLAACQPIIDNNAVDGVTWLLSYVAPNGKKSFCICDARDAQAVRRAVQRNGWPVDRITKVRVLDPYFFA